MISKKEHLRDVTGQKILILHTGHNSANTLNVPNMFKGIKNRRWAFVRLQYKYTLQSMQYVDN